jgi:futalosine hydrolase
LRERKYDVVVNAGICGSFNKSIPLGAVVNIVEDCFADQLVETGHDVISWMEAGIHANNTFPYVCHVLKPTKDIASLNLKPVKAITSDTVHGNSQSMEQIKSIFNPDVESMEGAAVFYVCTRLGIPVAEVRSVSNYVGIRDKSTWEIQGAIQNLTTVLIQLVNGI